MAYLWNGAVNDRVHTVMETYLVMENEQRNKVMEIDNILKKSWNFCTAYHESRIGSSDNSISIGDLAMGGFRFMFSITNRNVRQEANHLFDFLFSL